MLRIAGDSVIMINTKMKIMSRAQARTNNKVLRRFSLLFPIPPIAN